MKARGTNWFRAGVFVLFALGAVHLLAVYNAHFGAPGSPAEKAVDDAARALKYSLGPFHFTGWGLIQLLSVSYSVFILFVATLDLVALRPALETGCLRTLTVVNVIFVGLMLAATLVYQFPPPMVFAAVALVLFLISLLRQSPTAESSNA